MAVNPVGLLRKALYRVLRSAGHRLVTLSERVTPLSAQIIKREGNWVTCQVNGIIWRLNQTHYIGSEILKRGVFEPDSTRWIYRFVKPGMIVADVGANLGYYTVQLSRIVGAKGQVYAFEPSAQFHAQLVDHVQRNQCRNVVILDFGLSDQSVDSRLYGGSDSATMHWPDELSQPVFEETIKLRTLDSYVDEIHLSRLDFVKVDIDGNESRFAAGATQTLLRFQPIMVVEFSHVHLMEAGSGAEILKKQLTDLGYSLYSERTGKRYSHRIEFLVDAVNCTHSTNIICYPGNPGDNLDSVV